MTKDLKSPNHNLIETARAYVKAGLSIIPVNPAGHEKAKAPALPSWKDCQKRLPSDAELKEWFATDKHGIGLISGVVSGNLETLDFDEPGLVDSFMQSLKGYDLDLFEKVKGMPLVQTPSGGAHLRYRCAEPIEGNKKLAMTTDKKVRIETRGEGGYAVAPPSPGYALLQGDLTNLPKLSPDDRDLLHTIAKLEFDLTPVATYQATAEQPRAPRGDGEGRMPGEDYNDRGVGDALALLQRHGWQILRQRGEVYHLRKPNSRSKNPHATFGHKGAFLYVFSSSAPPFDNEKGYRPFAIYALLECNGDHSEAARQLALNGYGTPLSERPSPSIEHVQRLSEILEGEHDSAPEEDDEILIAVKISNLKNADFCTKNETQKPVSLPVWKGRGRRLKREKSDFDRAWAWAVGEWYNQAVEGLEYGEKERIVRGIFGEQLPTVRVYASTFSSWKRDDMKPAPGMTKNIMEVLAKAPKEIKEKYCHEWDSGTKWTADDLKARMEKEDGITFKKREKEVDPAKIALEMLQEAFGHEALVEFGNEILLHGKTKEILADLVTKLAARIPHYGEQTEKADTPEPITTTPPDPQEQPSTREVTNSVDSILESKYKNHLEASANPLLTESRDAQADAPEQVAVPYDVSAHKPPEASPAPTPPKVPLEFAVVNMKEHAAPTPMPDDDLPPTNSPPPFVGVKVEGGYKYTRLTEGG